MWQNGTVRIDDASGLWGLDTHTTIEKLEAAVRHLTANRCASALQVSAWCASP